VAAGTIEILLNVTPSTLHEKPAAVYVATGAVTQGALHAGDPITVVAISAAATPASDETLSIVLSLTNSVAVGLDLQRMSQNTPRTDRTGNPYCLPIQLANQQLVKRAQVLGAGYWVLGH
jgi:hypothetical protein